VNKPAWWPQNPYPTDIFPMERSEYPKIVPDPNVRGALSGCLGRVFWDIASNMIWDAMREAGATGEPPEYPEKPWEGKE